MLRVKDNTMKTKVSIVKSTDISARTRKAVDLIGGMELFISKGDVVCVKPNLLYPSPPPVTTDPLATGEIVKMCFEVGAKEVLVVEGGAPVPKRLDCFKERDVFELTGTRQIVEANGGEIVCLDEIKAVEVNVPTGVLYRKMKLYECMLKADKIISVPVMKTHYDTDISLGIKNFHGCIADNDKFWKFHRDDVSQKLVDIMKVLKPCLTVIDAGKAMEGTGPLAGTSVDMDLTIASGDVVSADVVGTFVMGIDDPLDVATNRIANQQKVGNGRMEDIEIIGENPCAVRKKFKLAPLALSAIYDNVTVIEGGVCRACRARTRWALDAKYKRGDFDGEHTTVIVGVEPYVPDPEEIDGKIYVVGDCACFYAKSLLKAEKGKVVFVRGCPPIPVPDMVGKYGEKEEARFT